MSIVSAVKRSAIAVARRSLEPFGHTITQIPHGGLGYLNYEDTARKARQLGQTIPDYYAHIRNEHGFVEALFGHIDKFVPFDKLTSIVEIGAGTGRFLEQVKRRAPTARQEIYETDPGWSQYLARSHGAVAHPTRGFDLAGTPDASADLVHADYVFAYLPATTCFRYFKEICRVAKPGGHVFFDAYFDEDCTLCAIEDWLKHSDSYEVVLPRRATLDLFVRAGCRLIDDSYIMKVYRGHTRYLIFQKIS